MTSLDTNVILRFLLRNIPDQTAKAISALAHSRCYVTDVVITEIIYVLEKVYEAPRKEIAIALSSFLSLPNLVCNSDLLGEMIDLYEKRSSLSIIDCYAAVESGLSGNQLITFDAKLLRHGGVHVIEP